jgi:predicted ATPase
MVIQPRTVLTLVPLLVVLIVSCESKRQRAREAIEAVEASCQRAKEHGGIDAALAGQMSAKVAVEELDYEAQPPYRDRLNEAWKPCADYTTRKVVEDALKPKGRPLTHKEEIKKEAAYEFLEEHARKRSRTDLYPYPDD